VDSRSADEFKFLIGSLIEVQGWASMHNKGPLIHHLDTSIYCLDVHGDEQEINVYYHEAALVIGYIYTPNALIDIYDFNDAAWIKVYHYKSGHIGVTNQNEWREYGKYKNNS
jgi:hypothetical protein